MQDARFHASDKKMLSCNDVINMLPQWKKEYPFLGESHSQTLQQTLRDLSQAYKSFFRRLKKIQSGDYSEGTDPGYPKFKRKYRHDSFRYPQGVKIEGRRIFLPKLGWYRFYKSREIDGVLKNVTVSRDGGEWFVSVQVEKEINDLEPRQEPSIGLDLNIALFCACSDGSLIAPLNASKKYSARLAKEQQKLSRKAKFSSNWKKQKAKVAKIHRKIRNLRRDFLHKLSTKITRRYGLVVLENLNIKNMTRSAKGTPENPGKNVRAKSGLNRSILDQGWGEFTRQLCYKSDWSGGLVLKVDPKYTSQTCSHCWHTAKKNRKSQSLFACEACGFSVNADYNAAKIILTLGQRGINACGDEGLPSSMKQEPAGTGNQVPTCGLITTGIPVI